ncbi:hypothetical protein [Nonomuraea gerenzanensis]|uniref:Uncharacterized protein n=1 Tax=Nonomuraea gerenzanensis TaxID=93944 RepID=A0A1M4E8W8_9ACTN|nr:hypothetical protein [Nonomuraea gerenzanensis]UBU17405.1 hypothetical protein LCN96_20980 [Nonomuraea gerenzanensis]SBO95158.1 hypothetical protein BN4615_P4674 [Nonomuraea gerenzanensis]
MLPPGAVRVLAAWLLHLRAGASVRDAGAPNASGPLPEAARAVLTCLDPHPRDDAALAHDMDLIDAIVAFAQSRLAQGSAR